MSIILENQIVRAGIVFDQGILALDFPEDPAFTLSETVLIDLPQRSIGIIYQNAYHHVGDLPQHLGGVDIERMTNVRLTGHGAGGREITLHAPVKILRKTA